MISINRCKALDPRMRDGGGHARPQGQSVGAESSRLPAYAQDLGFRRDNVGAPGLMTNGNAARAIDVTRLPGNLVELIDALGPGESLVITRDGEPIATISGGGGALEGVIVPGTPHDGTEQAPTRRDDVIVVATAMKLSASARAALSAELGTDYLVVDLLAAPDTTDVLLVPPISTRLIGGLRERFPKARLIVTEIEDYELGIVYQGPVGRMLDAGAETYLTSATIPRLARQLDQAITHRQIANRAPRLEIEPATRPPEPPG
jgi:antitoxin (DNA-binding transcriptional repressor) of toxin-antitoxin stability system